MGNGFCQHFLLFGERTISQLTVIAGQSQIAQSVEVAFSDSFPLIAKHLLPSGGQVSVLRHDVLDGQIIGNKLLLALVLNGSKDVFAEGILTIQIAFFQCLNKVRIAGDSILGCHLQHKGHDSIVIVRLVFFSCENTAVEGLVQAAQRVGTNLTNEASDAVMQQQVQHLSQFGLINDSVLIVIEDMEQEQIDCGLVQSAQTIQCAVDFRTQVFITIKEDVVLLGIVQQFIKHGFVGVLAVEVYLLEVSVCFAFFGEAIHLHVQIVQEEALHAVLGQQFLHNQPIFLIQPFLIVIRHQYIVADKVGQTKLNARGVDTLEDLLRIVILVELNVGADQAVHAVMDHHNGVVGVFGQESCDQVPEQHIVVINNAVLALVHLIKLSCHEQLQLIVVRLDGFQLQLALIIKAIAVELVFVVEVLLQFSLIAFIGGRIRQCLDENIQSSKSLLTVNDDVTVDMLSGGQRSIDKGTAEVLTILFECQNNILKQLFALFGSPGIIPLKDRNTILFFVGLNVVIQHSSTFNSHKPDAPFFVFLIVYLVFRLKGSLRRRLFL